MRLTYRPRTWPLVLLAALAALPPTGPSRADEDDKAGKGDQSVFKHLKYRLIGPFAGGRVSRSAGVPGDPLVYYAGAASGGVWKTTDGGTSWKPIFDDQPTSSIGAVAVAPSDPNVVYVGSGEADIRGNIAAGNGIYRSTDGGKSWQHVWKQEGQVGRIAVHPKKADVAYAAVLGHAFGPNPERGVYRTTDGGKTWQQVLKKDADTGAIEVRLDPSNPRVLFAALWQARRRPWELTSGGPGSGLYRSADGGDSWKQLKGHGLPAGIWGRVGVAVAGNGRTVYALIEADKGGLFRSDDGGDSWNLVNKHRYLRIRPWYFGTVHVDPHNPEVVYCPSLHLLKSIDGGKSFTRVKGPHHVDHHDLWIDPTNPRRMIDSNDGGIDITVNGGDTWLSPLLPVGQFYHVNVDTRVPYHVSGPMQDLGTAAGPSNSLSSAGIRPCDWYTVGGGETGFTAPDPADPNVVYAGEYGGYLSRFDLRTRQARNISIYPYNTSGRGAGELRYRFQWTAPVLVSPHDPKVVYHAANVLFRTADAGRTWEAISPDLTRDDKSKQQWSGGPITGDNTGAEYYCTIFAVAESPKEKGLLWAGSDDGLVHVKRPGGKWVNVTRDLPGLPEWGTVSCIEASPFDAGTAYVVVDAHRLDDLKPYLYRTTDYGQTWQRLGDKLPQDVYLHVARADPKAKGLLYVGTERGVAFSPDDGATWLPLKMNLPTVAVHDLVVKDNDLVVGTSGRSIWIFDDLTPVRALRNLATKKEADYPGTLLLDVQPTVRWRYHPPVHSTEERTRGDNPPKGAVVHYYLKKKAKKVALEVRDDKGGLVRELSSEKDEYEPPPDPLDPPEDVKKQKEKRLPKEQGLHRVVWDLHYQGARTIKGAKVDSGEPREGPLVTPGVYTIKLTVDGQALPEKKVEVRLDPRVSIPAEELKEQLKLALAVRDDISRVADMANGLRSVRGQTLARHKLLKAHKEAAPLLAPGKALLGKLDALEAKLHNPKAEVAYDILAQKGGAKLYSQLVSLLEVLREADGAPGQGVREVYAEHARELRQLEGEFRALVTGELARLNEAARKLDVPAVLVPRAP
jgi:photosystem II stability/assembly factor-like uncharacterized protein